MLIEKQVIRSTGVTAMHIAVVIDNQEYDKSDRVICAKGDRLDRIAQQTGDYDDLQYPSGFFQGEDGYHLTLKLRILILQEDQIRKFRF